MTRIFAAALLFAASVSLTAPQTVEAQLGGLIKKKVKEAIKPPQKPAETPAAPTAQPSSEPTSTESDGLPRLPYNGGLLITSETLARLARGLDAEMSLLADFQKVLSKYPTLQEYEDCRRNAMMTPEGQKIALKMAELPENATHEQAQALITKVGEETEAFTRKKCPNDPHDWTDHQKSERLKEIHRKAASMARGQRVSFTRDDHQVGQPVLLFDVDPYEALPDTATDTVKVLGVGGLSERDYSLLIERVVSYCGFKKTMDMSPKKGGIKAPGAGLNVFWRYTEEELVALKSFNCDAFMKKYASIVGAYQ